MGLSLRINRCCCMSLRTGGLVIGWLNIVLFVFMIIITSKRIIFYDHTEIPTPGSNEYRPAKTLNGEIASLVFYVVDAFVSVLLIVGIVKKKHNLLIPWLVFRGFGLLLAIPGVLIVIVFALVSLKVIAIVVTLIIAFFIGLFVWIWIVIFSLFQEIRETVVNKPLNVVQLSYPMPTPVPYYESRPVPPVIPYQNL